MESFSPEPIVTLENAFEKPYDNAVAAARTCYSGKGVVHAADVATDEATRARSDAIAESIYKAGHHTVIQHATFQFVLDKVSRQFIWSFLHAHPYYNCLAGETEIPHFHGNAVEPWTIQELYERFHNPAKRIYIEKMHIRSVDEKGNIVPNKIRSVIHSGRRQVYKIKTLLGYEIRATGQHRFMRQDATWARVHELTVGDEILVNGVRSYKDPKWLEEQYRDKGLNQREIADLASTTPFTIRKWIRRFKLQKPLGSWTRGVAPHNKGKSKENYEPLMKTSRWALSTGHRPPLNGGGPLNSNWKGKTVKNPRDRARLWYPAIACEVCYTTKEVRRIERHHINKNIYDNSSQNIIVLCALCHKATESPHRTIMRVTVDRVLSITPDGETDTYDLVMEAPHHNFVANGFIVHNSEQVSQRYVEVKPENFAIPPLPEAARALYITTIQRQMDAYQKLIELVQPTVHAEYGRIFPNRKIEEKRWRSAMKKKQQEVARYVLPVATHAFLYHTVSGITLHRYNKLVNQFDSPLEQRLVVSKMVEAVNQHDPDFFKLLEDPIPLDQTQEYRMFEQLFGKGTPRANSAFIDEFDGELSGRISKLIDYKVNAEATMAQSIRSVLGLTKSELSDVDALDQVLNPAKDRYLAQTLNVSSMGKLTRSMVHPNFTFKKKLSHTADSQDQRHRATPGSRPVLFRHFLPERPDYILPVVIEKTPAALELFVETMNHIWTAMRQLLEWGVSEEFVMYLLPNAFPIRFEESGDLMAFHHKWTSRLCYTAQEEIWKSCHEEVQQVQEHFPNLAKYILPPCGLRKLADVKPFCPEGDRFCGVAVWKLPLEEYSRVI